MPTKATKKYLLTDSIILDEIYPLVESAMNNDSPKTFNSIKKAIEKFVHDRHAQLYDYAPIDRIYFRKAEVTEFFKAIGFKEKEISDIVPKLYYWKKDELQACKDEFSLTFLMVLRYLAKHKTDSKNLELFLTYYAFSGKYYASCHVAWFRHYTPKREVMDYVINYMLNGKYDIVKTGNVWGAIKNLATTWYDSYKDELAGDITDERVTYLIHQLHNRIYSFLRNIAKLYYEANEKKLYLNAESDDYSQEKYRIANNNSTVAYNITEKAMNRMSSTQVDIALCYQVSGSGVDPYEVKAIFENIMSKNETLNELREVINILIVDFMNNYPDEQDITGAKFIAHSISMKPNTKNKDIIRLKNIIYSWLNTSERYKSIKTPMTQNNYFRAMVSYIAINVNIANKQ